MLQEEFLEGFKSWSVKLGCDKESMPGEDALKAIYKSPQKELFKNLMMRVLPRDEVEAFRENLLINKIEKLNNEEVIPLAYSKSFLPKEMQKFHKLSVLNVKKVNLLKRLDEHRKEYETLAASIKIKNIKSTKFEHNKRLLQSRVTVFEFKNESLDKQLAEEKDNEKRIRSTVPVKLTTQPYIDKKAMESVLKTLRTLENFYKITGTDNMSAESTEGLWKEIRLNLSDIPNASIYKAVMYLKDKQLQNIKAMNKHISNKSLGFVYNPSSKKESFSSYKIKSAKAKASLLGVVSKYIKARKERTRLEEHFVKIYIEFVDKLQHKLNLNTSKSDEIVEDIMSNYLLQLTSINFSNSENEYLEKQIEHLRTDIENTNMQIQNHEVLLGFIRKVYCDINASVNRLQFDMMQLNLIKSKIVYSKNVLQQMLNQMKSSASTISRWSMDLRNSFLQPQKKINDVTFSAESFAMGTEHVLCSTKFDFDNTVSSLSSNTLLQSFCSGDTTIISTGTNNNLPAYLMELNIFAETPIENFSRMSQQCAFHLSPNPIVTASQELSPAVQFTPGALLTTYGALNEIISRIKLTEHLARTSSDAKFKLDLIYIDANLLKEKHKLQQERILQILDKIKETNISTNYILNKCSKLYNFRLENSLRHYIPPSKTFNDQTYSEYESEYNLYYRLATEDTSTN